MDQPIAQARSARGSPEDRRRPPTLAVMIVLERCGYGLYLPFYCPETAGVYLVPISDVDNRAMCSLRVTQSRNGQKRRIRTAANYKIGTVRIEPSSAPRVSSGAPGSSA